MHAWIRVLQTTWLAQSKFPDALPEVLEIYLVRTTVTIQANSLPYLQQSSQQLVQRAVHLRVPFLCCSGKESMAANQRHRVMFAKVTVTKTKIVLVVLSASSDLMEGILKSLVVPLEVPEISLEQIIAMILVNRITLWRSR